MATRHDHGLLVAGAPGSPYTRKMLAVLRYRRMPYRYVMDTEIIGSLPPPRVRLLPTFYFPRPDGALEPMVDSTLIIRRLDAEQSQRPVAPACDALALLDALVEDYADEWLTKAMFHYRWTHEADIQKSVEILPIWFEPPMDDATRLAKGRAFADRQIGRLRYVGSNPVTAPAIEASFLRLIGILERHFARHPFVFGSRPAAADFALHGQLTQAAIFDPTPSALVMRHAPRVLAWTVAMEDQSGLESDDLFDVDRLPDTTLDLLREVGATHVPLLLANARALAESAPAFGTTIDAMPWEQPTFPYHGKCLDALRARHDALGPRERRRVATVLRPTGCLALFQDSATH